MLSHGALRKLHFGSLYFAQGAILSYFLTFNILYLRNAGFAAGEIGFFQATLVLPFVLKIVLGMVSDRFSLLGLGHRYPYIILGLMLQCFCFVVLPEFALPSGLWAFFVTALCAAVGMAFYDTSTDGLAVESTAADKRAQIQAIMVSARAAGILVPLLLGGWIIDYGGWSMLFHLVAALTLPALLLTLVRWQRPVQARAQVFAWSAFRSLAGRDALIVAVMGLIYALALDGVLAYLSYHPLADSVSDVGMVSGLIALSMLGRIAGALSNGRLTAQLGYRNSMAIAVGLSALACYGLSLSLGPRGLALSCFLFGFSYGYFTAAYSAVAMALSDPRIAASMFAVFMMFLNIGIAIGQAVGGMIASASGFSALAWIMALVVLLNLVLIRILRLA